jgi:SAM-dependent methyltransferase
MSDSTDAFRDRAEDYDARPIPQQISEGVFSTLSEAISFSESDTVLDFGAGTGLVATRIAPKVKALLAVDISPSMLAKLEEKDPSGTIEVVCQDIVTSPLGRQVDVVVSAMAAHHVSDTAALLRTLHAHLKPGGRLALADLDAEPGTFHPPEVDDVHHHGFDRDALAEVARAAGFEDVAFRTACTVFREERPYPVFLLTATRPEHP